MSDSNRFGRVITPGQVERAVIGTLEKWIDTYLGELERVEGYAPDSIQRPLGVISLSEFEKWPEDQIPVILVINAGLHNPPERHGRTYSASWQIGIAPLVSDVNFSETRTLAMAYVAAIRNIFVDKGKLKSDTYPDGFADWLTWLDENYNDVPFLSSRNLAAGRVVIEVGVENVATVGTGPTEPVVPARTDPGPWPPVVETNVIPIPRNAVETVT